MSLIQPFWGEFGLVPIPLEVSHNFCSHKCSYCFANLNSPNRTADVAALTNQLRKYPTQKNIAATMLQHKLCVAVSNKTDPFARSNYRIAIPMLESLTADDIPVFIQTRGGIGVDDALKFMKPSVFYVSITHSGDETRKLIEPAAPSIESRWALVDQLKALGHKVLVACNPYHSYWVDNEEFLRRLDVHRPDGLVLQLLHLNPKQTAQMSERERANFGEVSLKIAQKRNIDQAQYAAMLSLHHSAQAMGIKIKNYNAPELINDAVAIYHEVYGNKVFKTKFDFVEHCRATKQDNDVVTFREYRDYMLSDNPLASGSYDIKSYLTSQSQEFRNGVKMPSRMNFTDILKIMWNEPKARKMLSDISAFAILVEKDAEGEYAPVDEDNNLLMVWNSQTFDDETTDFCNQQNQ